MHDLFICFKGGFFIKKIVIFLAILFVFLNTSINANAKEINKNNFEIIKLENSINFLVYTPEDYYETYNEYNYPLILYLHGAGERGNNIEKLMDVSLPKYLNEDLINPECVIIIPQCPKGTAWTYLTNELDIIMEYSINRFRIDAENINITGHSLGANGCISYAIHNPIFNNIIPLSIGNVPNNFDLTKLKDSNIYLYHENKDLTYTNHYNFSIFLYDKLSKLDYTTELVIVPNKTHALTDIYLDENYNIINLLIKKAPMALYFIFSSSFIKFLSTK